VRHSGGSKGKLGLGALGIAMGLIIIVFRVFLLLLVWMVVLVLKFFELATLVASWKCIRSTNEAEKKGKISYPKGDRVSWLWDYFIHHDRMLANRTHFFLVAESMLVVSYAVLASAASPRTLVMTVITCLGIFFTKVWLYMSRRTATNTEKLNKRLEDVIPEYKEIRDERRGIRTNTFLGTCLPLATLVAWFFLLILIWI